MPDGGAGGDGGAAQRDSAEAARRSSAIDKINSYFGVQPTASTVTQYPDGTPVDPNNPRQVLVKSLPTPGYNQGNAEHGIGPLNPMTAGGTRAAPTVSVINPLGATATTNAAERAKLYDDTSQNVLDLNTQKLKEFATNAERDQRFGLARSGLSGSSQAVDADALFKRTYDQSVADASTKADQAALDFKTSDENSRLNLINQINAGGDANTAITGGVNALNLNAQNARTGAAGRLINNSFGDIAQQYAYGNSLAGQQQAAAIYGARFNPNAGGPVIGNTSYTGTRAGGNF